MSGDRWERLQELFLAFSRGVSATLRLGVALETLAQDANALFGEPLGHQTRVRVFLGSSYPAAEPGAGPGHGPHLRCPQPRLACRLPGAALYRRAHELTLGIHSSAAL